MSLAEVTTARSPTPEACPECDTGASVTSDLHKYQVACTCKPSAQYACADDPGPPPSAKTDTPPALPPRPPTSVLATNRRNNATVGCNNNEATCRRKKYAWWCCGCGALAAALGGLLAAQHILLRAYTASPQHLETVPAAVPAAMLVLTGVCIMSLARRRNRYSYMIKVVGACCLVCALTCVLVTITTTVIHMNKLQTLKFCEYTKATRTCTCYSMPPEKQHSVSDDEGVRCVFEGMRDCGVVHGALYWCLRGVFALSVTAVLVCIFSCMLAYQLLSHERKKMYWEQLELRCRSLYRPPSGAPAPSGRPVQNSCSCCAQCHTAQPGWDFSLQHRFWAPGRIGNLYSPNPGSGRKTSPWSWFPWPRGNTQAPRCRVEGAPQSGDSAYGFCETEQNQQYDERSYPTFNQFQRSQSGNFGQMAPGQMQSAGNFPQGFGQYQEGFGEASGSFDAQTGVWGPPPPYSPQGRSGSRHQLHQDPAATTLLHHHHIDVHNTQTNTQTHTCRNSFIHNVPHDISRLNPDLLRLNPDLMRINPELMRINPDLMRVNPELMRMNPELMRMNPDLMRLNPDMRLNQEMQMYPQELAEGERFNTLRGHLVPYRNCQRLGVSVASLHDCRMDDAVECVHQKNKEHHEGHHDCQKQGKENLAFQNDKNPPMGSSLQDCHRGANQNTESEVYFADVSSCCNADCCVNPNISALVGTIENHPESTSESETGSFTLTRQQRPQPQVGSKRRSRQADKKARHDHSIRLIEQQIENLNNSIRMTERVERIDSRDRLNVRRDDERIDNPRIERIDDSRNRLNESSRSDRLNESRIERINDPRFDDSRIERMSERSDRFNDSRIFETSRIERNNDARLDDPRIERLSQRSDRFNDSKALESSRIERMNDPRLDDSRIERLSDRSERFNDSRMLECSRIERIKDPRYSSGDRNERTERMNEGRINENKDRVNRERMSDRFEDRRISDLNSSIRIESSPKTRPQISPLRMSRRDSPQNSKHETTISPLSPNTEESLLSDDDAREIYTNESEAKCLGPDSQYEPVREKKEEVLKMNHHHCYSDTNTMDSGWQSGSEKQVTD
ncbi:uncharacterized protein LOC126968297 isoform X2 [Leptidea sinapis]|uniref:uncharacterized protein LOC126968297 isoform X2 n=1 Tax=Leptidea sinapis TaxID=189913 RepID=UPI0021C3807F|nr:uncharacterized protein LOC126968297 isoform X2 [Leptidea sinapis]